MKKYQNFKEMLKKFLSSIKHYTLSIQINSNILTSKLNCNLLKECHKTLNKWKQFDQTKLDIICDVKWHLFKLSSVLCKLQFQVHVCIYELVWIQVLVKTTTLLGISMTKNI